MSYTSANELPTEVRRAFAPEDALIWMNEYNKAFEFISEDTKTHPAEYIHTVEFYAREQAWEACTHLPSSRFVKSNVSTQIVDRDGDVADVDSYVDAGQQFVEDGGQVTRNHSNKTIGCTWKIEKGIDEQTGEPCVVASTNFFRGKPTYEKAWQDFRSHKLGWSIASMTTSKRECDMNSCYNILYPSQWFELSLVNYPRNPRTYDIDYNESAKGVSVIDMHEDECPIRAKYEAFKEKMKSCNLETHVVESGVILLKGQVSEDAEEIISDTYPESYVYKGKEGDEDYALVIPHIDDKAEFLDYMVFLIEDEKEAIEGYKQVVDALAVGNYLSDGDLDATVKAFEEVIRDEENHIGVILGVIKHVSPELFASIAEGMSEADEAMKGCPAGQHEHAGIVGCHDIFRKHSIDYQTQPSDVLDLTDEDIDVNAIKETPTDKLRGIVVRIAQTLARMDKNAINDFMSHTAGKEFVLAYLELKKRKIQGENNMTEAKVDTPIEAPADAEADKGYLADPHSILQNISSVLATIVSQQDMMNTRLMRMEAKLAQDEAEQSGGDNLATAIMEGVGGMGADPVEAKPEKVPPEIPAPAKEEKETEEKVEVSDDGEKEEVEEKVEDKDEDKEEKSDEDESEEKTEEKTEESEEKTEESDGDESEKKEESKEETKEEKKDDEKSKGEDVPEETISESDEKGCDKKGEEPAISEEKGDDVTVVAPVDVPKEEDKCGAGQAVKAEEPVGDAGVTVSEEVKPAENQPTEEPQMEVKSDDFQYPEPPGGNAMDLRSAVQKRQEELKAKGINYSVAPSNSTSLAGQTGGVSIVSPNLRAVNPSNIGAFNGDIGTSNAYKDSWKSMGQVDPKTFLRQIIGE